MKFGTFILLVLSLLRYAERRFKSTNSAYWAVITFVANETKTSPKDGPISTEPTHAGGVVLRRRWWWSREKECLLVEAKNDPAELVLPKGHIEGDEDREDPRVTAVRAVHEETGVWARIVRELDVKRFPQENGSDETVQFFLMEKVGRGLESEKDREHYWLPLKTAMAEATYPETRELLAARDERG